MNLDEMNDQQIRDAVARADEGVLLELAARVNRISALIEDAGVTGHHVWHVPDTAANRFAAEFAQAKFHDVTISIRSD